MAVTDQRQKINFNRDWKFIRQNVSSAEKVGYDDSSWVDVGLPHAFDAPYDVGGTLGGQNFYVGVGWYRKTFDVPASWNGKNVEIEFEAAAMVADVYVNGTKVGTHCGGYTGFDFDITQYLHTGTNVIAARVDNSWQVDLAPRTGDHQFMGGIYRDVYLDVSDPVHVTWYGTFVTTPALTNPEWDTSNPAYYQNIDLSQYPSDAELAANIAARRSNVSVQTELRNDGSTPQDVYVHQVVTKQGSDQVLAAFNSGEQTLAPGQTATLDAVSGGLRDTASMLTNLDLWAPNDPALYTVTTSVVTGGTGDSGTVVDSYQTTFGFRSAQWKTDGFYLNGVKTLLVGADAHQDHGGWGNAVTDSGFYRDVEMIREAGMNFIRGSHYPHAPAYADATDELGVMLWSESDFWATATAGREGPGVGNATDYLKDGYPQNAADQTAFEQSTLDQLAEMIRIDRNHPSIINWSMGNEVFFTSSSTLSKATALVNKMRNLAHQLDPTRKAGMGGVQRSNLDQLSVSDIAGYNGDGAKVTNTWMPNMVTEYGSYTSDRPGTYAPEYGDTADPANSSQFKLNTDSAGLALWASFDHGTVFGPSLARMGMIDYYRLPKQQWYWYRANKGQWTSLTNVADPVAVPREQSTPGTATKMVLTPSKYASTTITDDGTDDTQLVVTMENAAGTWVNDSSRTVTLTVTSGPGILPGGKTYTFTPGQELFDGKAAIEFRSYYPGVTTITATAKGLPDATVQITTTDTVGATDDTEPANFGNASLWGARATTIADPVSYSNDNQALSHPMSDTSEQADHGAALAADGDTSTYWAANATGPGQSVSVFLEQARYLYKVAVTFPGAPLPYTVSVQGDDGTWTDVASYTADTLASRPVETSLNGVYAEYVRISFPNLAADQRAEVSEITILGNLAVSPDYSADGAYLSDVVDYTHGIATSGTPAGKNETASGNTIAIGGVTYHKGIGLSGTGTITYNAGQKYTRIAGIAGIDDETTAGNVTFSIYGDGQLIYTKTLSGTTASNPFDLSISGVSTIKLVTTANGSSTDSAVWADARLFGATRDISAAGTSLRTTLATLSDQLQAGDPYRATLTIANSGTSNRNLRVAEALYDSDGKLLDTDINQVQVTAGKTASTALSVPLGTHLDAGDHLQVDAWDASTLQLVTSVVWVGADPGKLTSTTQDTPVWTTKVDGQSTDIVTTGTWSLYSTSAAYNSSETYTNSAGATMSYTFTGAFVRIAAKFDGSQSGFDVYVDGTKVSTVSTKVSDGSNTYKVAWTSNELPVGQHTVTIITTGKAGIDYFEYGTAAQTGDTPVWTTKADGQSTDIVTTGTWSLYSTSAAYNSSETYTNSAGATMSYTFTGAFVRIAAKFDGSQSGFDVYVDGTKVSTVSTKVSDGSNTYKVAWTSNELPVGQHTVTIITTGKAGIDYFEYGTAAQAPAKPASYTDLIEQVGRLLDFIGSGHAAEYPMTRRTAVEPVFADAYATLVNESSSAEDYGTAASQLVVVLDKVLNDNDPPTTTINWSPSQPDGEGGWYRSAPSFQLDATDTAAVADVAGVASTQYLIDGGDWTDYTGTPVTVSKPGTHQIEYRSTDKSGNVEEPKEATVKVDTAAPTVASTMNTTDPSNRLVTLTATDADSGLATLSVKADNGDWAPYTQPISLNKAKHAVAYRASDVAGNQSQGVLNVPATAAITSQSSLTLTNQMKLTAGDVQVRGDFACDSQVQVAGSVLVTGSAYLTNTCRISGDVIAGGNLTMDSTPSVGGSVSAVGSVRLQSTAKVGGSISAGTTFTVTDGKTVDYLTSHGIIGGAVNVGVPVSPPTLTGFTPAQFPADAPGLITWRQWMNATATANNAPSWSQGLTANPGCTMAPWSSSVNGNTVTVASDLVVDARTATSTCTGIALQQMMVKLRGDLVIYADKLDVTNGIMFVSDDGKHHSVKVIVTGSNAQTGAVTISANSTTDSLVDLAIHTPGKVTVQGTSALTAAIESGAFTASGSVTVR